MADVFAVPEDLSEYLFRIVDNGGSSADRYTVVFSDGSTLAMSANPTHPQGVSLCNEWIDPQVVDEWVESGEAVDLALGDLPAHLVEHIMFRNNEGLEDFLYEVERDRRNILDKTENYEPRAVSRCREDAEANEGLYDSLGKAIYLKEGMYFVKMEGGPDDRGPYENARDVVLATVPDQYALAGPEYHSTVDVMRLEPSPEVLRAVSALEARRKAEWEAEFARNHP